MAFDAGMLHAVVWELENKLTDAKIEKITQPAKDEIDIALHRYGQTLRLCIRAGSHLPRISLTAESKESPAVPPMFCMLLRKHLSGAKLLRVTQLGYERACRLTFSAYDDMGFPVEKHLVAEIMGKYSNLLLLGADDRILGVLRAVDFTTSRLRQLLPGMTYELPPVQDKIEPLSEDEPHFLATLLTAPPEKICARWMADTYLGTAVQVAQQIVYNAIGRIDARVEEVSPKALWQAFFAWFDNLKNHRYEPTLVLGLDGSPLDFCYAGISYYGSAAQTHIYPDFCTLMDACYAVRENGERMHQRAADLFGILERSEARLLRKVEAQQAELATALNGEEWQRKGDLITANIWRLKRGDTLLVTEDFYAEEPMRVEIPLDARLTPSMNAQRYYKLYTKAKHARIRLTEQLSKSREELVYLESVREFLNRAETEADLTEIREELYRAGYASRMKGYSSPKQMKLRPIEFTSPTGYKVFVGRNNIQNDRLTFHTAVKNDLWFHAKGVPGSHVVLLCDGAEPPAEDYTFAASLAARYSRAAGEQVPVDYTRVRYVKKPPGAKPGYVTYQTNYTAFVSAELPKKETIE